MLFHTPIFGLFLVVTLLVAASLRQSPSARKIFLLAASYAFYMAWDARYLLLILFSTAVDYAVGAAIPRAEDPRRRKLLLIASVVTNLGVLATFKYYGFFVENMLALARTVGLEPSLPVLDVVLPVGISFYTFQTMSYTIEIYRGNLEPRKNLVDFALFVAFFPQLVAGPIVRAREFLPQLDRAYRYDERQASSGLYLILKGLIKKAVFADVIGSFLVDRVYADPSAFGGFCIAIGCGRLLGFELPQNFRSPYKATSIRDYWSRWHMTLGRWFRDFVFFPLGGSRGKPARVYANLLGTMALVGLWHGPSWIFVLWGTYYGVLLCIERTWLQFRKAGGAGEEPRLPWLVRVVVTFNLTAIGSMVFRSADMDQLRNLAAAMFSPASSPVDFRFPLVAFALAAMTHFAPDRFKAAVEERFIRLPAIAQAAACVAVIVQVRLAGVRVNPFYYFQF